MNLTLNLKFNLESILNVKLGDWLKIQSQWTEMITLQPSASLVEERNVWEAEGSWCTELSKCCGQRKWKTFHCELLLKVCTQSGPNILVILITLPSIKYGNVSNFRPKLKRFHSKTPK